MKKVFAVLAVLAVAVAAQAELLAEWSISASSQSVDNKNANILFDDMKATGLGGGLNGANYRLNNWVDGGNVTGGTLDIDFMLEDAYTFKLDSITGSMSLGGNPAAANFKWQNENGVDITGVASATKTSSNPMTWTANDNAVWTSDGTLKLIAADGKNTAGGNAAATSRSDMQSGLKVYGDVSAVPEPATMSLLGLGALAMALRRKLRK